MTIWEFIVIAAGLLATPALAISYLPQIIQNQKTKNVSGISINFWLILDASLLCFFILALDVYLSTGAWVLLSAQFINLVLALVVTGQVIAFSKKKEK